MEIKEYLRARHRALIMSDEDFARTIPLTGSHRNELRQIFLDQGYLFHPFGFARKLHNCQRLGLVERVSLMNPHLGRKHDIIKPNPNTLTMIETEPSEPDLSPSPDPPATPDPSPSEPPRHSFIWEGREHWLASQPSDLTNPTAGSHPSILTLIIDEPTRHSIHIPTFLMILGITLDDDMIPVSPDLIAAVLTDYSNNHPFADLNEAITRHHLGQ